MPAACRSAVTARRAGPQADRVKGSAMSKRRGRRRTINASRIRMGTILAERRSRQVSPRPRSSPSHFLQTNPANDPVRVTLTSRYMLRSRSSRLAAVSNGGVKNPIGTQNACTKRSVIRFCPLT